MIQYKTKLSNKSMFYKISQNTVNIIYHQRNYHKRTLIDEINFGTSTGDTISIALAAYNLGVGNINRYLEEIQINLNKENFEITWNDLSSFLTEEVNHNELIGNSTNYKRGIQAVDYVTRVKDYYYLILGLGCNQELINWYLRSLILSLQKAARSYSVS